MEEVSGDPAAAAAARAALEGSVGRLADELRLSVDYYGAQEEAAPVEDLVLCGWGSAIPGLPDQLGAALGRRVSVRARRPWPASATAKRPASPFPTASPWSSSDAADQPDPGGGAPPATAPARTGPIAYIFVGSLAALLLGVVMLVLASNQISDREAEIDSLEDRKALISAEAEKLSPYIQLPAADRAAHPDVASLADSRFDWVRVIRQLSLILPPRVYLTTMTGSAGGGEGNGRKSPGPRSRSTAAPRGRTPSPAWSPR